MEQIKSKPFYAELVEHYFRMSVRYPTAPPGMEDEKLYWYDFTTFWIEGLSKEDKEFIRFVFKRLFINTGDGLYHYKSDCGMSAKRKRLWELEKRFAVDAELIGVSD
ncbi:MAG: hypothetical protein PUH30_10265 [Oscillospiraceae bacterium]|nr:hypothetical protein [Oscillospiraceae bacterium]